MARKRGRPVAPRPARPRSRARRHRPSRRPRAGDGRRPELPQEPVQPGRAGPAPDGLGVQAVRAHGGGRAGDLAADRLHLRADRHQPGRQALVGQQLRGLLPRVDRPAGGDDPLRQHRLRTAHVAGRAASRSPPWRTSSASPGRSTTTSRSGSASRRSARSRWRARSRRSPTAAAASTARCSATSRARCSGWRTASTPTPTTPSRRRLWRRTTPPSSPRSSSASSARAPGSVPRSTTGPWPGRRGRRRTTATPGSWATPRSSRSRCGWATRTGSSRWRPSSTATPWRGEPSRRSSGARSPSARSGTSKSRPRASPTRPTSSIVARQVVFRNNKTLLDNGNCQGSRQILYFVGSGPEAEADCKPNEVDVPNVIGSRLAAAKAHLASMPLVADVVWRRAEPGERLGFVVDQKPRGGTLSSWSTVRIVLPRAGNGRVPRLVGLTVEQARRKLARRMLGVARDLRRRRAPRASSWPSSRAPGWRPRAT